MKFSIFDFDRIDQYMVHEELGELVNTADYFQYYTTGIENIVVDPDNEFMFFKTKRYESERSDVLAYDFYDEENFADVLVAINNDNFLWDAPMNFDTELAVINAKVNYIKKINKAPLTYDEEKYWKRKITGKVDFTNNSQMIIVAPYLKDIRTVIRKIKKYFMDREVK